MTMTWIGRIRRRNLGSQLVKVRSAYTESDRWSAADVHRWQLDQFNRVWTDVRRNVPFYASINAPDRFSNWEEVVQSLPPTTKANVQQEIKLRSDTGKPPDTYRITGGSTAQPVRLPAWNSESAHTLHDMWTARSWYGIDPASHLFLLWGHSHLLGSGWRGKVNAWRRALKDRMLGYTRFSAYDLTEPAMHRAADALLRCRPAYVIGYSVALDTFVRANTHRSDEFQTLNLRAVVATAEGFPKNDSADMIGRILHCPVAMEYGAVETHVIAHTHPHGGFRTMWRSCFIEATEPGTNPGSRIIRVTSLYPRCFPLIRYEIGDQIELDDDGSDGLGVHRFAHVQGRCNQFVDLPDGRKIHSESVAHAIKESDDVIGYQLVQGGNLPSTLRLKTAGDIGTQQRSSIESTIRGRLARIDPMLAQFEIAFVDQLELSVAGKTPSVIQRDLLSTKTTPDIADT